MNLWKGNALKKHPRTAKLLTAQTEMVRSQSGKNPNKKDAMSPSGESIEEKTSRCFGTERVKGSEVFCAELIRIQLTGEDWGREKF